MAFPTSRQVDSAERVATSIDTALSAMLDQAQAFRTLVNTSSSANMQVVRQLYMALTSTRRYIEEKKTVEGLADAYERRFPALGSSFDAAAEWAASKTALDTLVSWLQTNLPKDASNRPVFEQFNGTTGELEFFTISITGGGKTQLLANLDAMLATFS